MVQQNNLEAGNWLAHLDGNSRWYAAKQRRLGYSSRSWQQRLRTSPIPVEELEL